MRTRSYSRSGRMIRHLMRYVIPQGSVTLDGISLTVVAADRTDLHRLYHPAHASETALQHKQSGSVINIECDVLGKYVDHLLHYKGDAATGKPSGSGPRKREA